METKELEKKEQSDFLRYRFEKVAAEIGISMEALAERGKISKPTLYRMINEGISEKNSKTFFSFCVNLGINDAWLLNGDGEMFTGKAKNTTSDLAELLEKIEAHWKKENEFLKESVRTLNERLDKKEQQLSDLIALIPRPSLKLEATSIEPQEEKSECVEYSISPIKREFRGLRVVGE